jgi:hypothetical protein
LDRAPRAIEPFREEPEESFIGGSVDRRRGDLDLQLVSEDRADGVFTGAGLELDLEIHSIGVITQARWQAAH